ncbi:CDP-6-deoxy-L-threo-D-glycero-4-hexulose-3-dehydrase reductase [Vibrio spartinae]|uniref:CDP-6-deoxy-L-threo-D-glycero-4-hexulose-3-dehydrase reductase n=2 Tax=Vibrio spartinae TaxID=1918945 RepID=A0ABX6QVF1_9VIBR|nr:CDP-6-deoxy-L-threo-D-glycero-4-hexulose-3-dehydrase reductase [Vibrio spartinae]
MVTFESDDNILKDALLKSIPLEHSCKTGGCGLCKAEIISGTALNEDMEEVSVGTHILTCQSKALSNLSLKVNYFPELANIESKIIPCKVSGLEFVTEDIVIIKLRLPPNKALNYMPGQYIDLFFKGISRSYSIADFSPDRNELELHIRRVPNGKLSSLIFEQLHLEQLMRIEGPKGTFFVRNDNKDLIFLATGTGIAPIKSMIHRLIDENDIRKKYIYWGGRYDDEIYCKDFYQLDADFDNITFIPVLSRNGNNIRYVQHAVDRDFDSLSNVSIYACGSLSMINDVRELLVAKGMSLDSFYYDAFISSISKGIS